MNWKTLSGVALVVVVGVIVGLSMFGKPHGPPRAPLTLTFRLSVSPKEQVDAVAANINSIKFKYEMGKKAEVKPVFAQSLAIKPVPGTSMLEVQVGVTTKTEGERYAAAFVESLQSVCGNETQLTMVHHLVR